MRQLTDEDQAILEFERLSWTYPGAKEAEVLKRFGLKMTTYYMRLNRIISTDEALAHDPLLVKRLRRLRTARARQRSSRRLGFDLDEAEQ